MCGRYALTTPASVIAHVFRLGVAHDYPLRWNIAPTQMAPVIRADRRNGERRLELMRWGLVPFWAKDRAIGSRMINARSETVNQRPAFRSLLARHRCVVPADAFYEWSKAPQRSAPGAVTLGVAAPYAMRLADDRAFGFAGLWDRWKAPDGEEREPLETYTILTTVPNSVAGAVHDRMPVMLIAPEQWDLWLDGGVTDASCLQPLLRPIADHAMRAYPVSQRVNSPANDDADLLRETDGSGLSGDGEPGLFK